MRKLILLLSLCFLAVAVYAQPSKGGFTLSSEYEYSVAKHSSATHAAFLGLEYFVSDHLSLGVGVSYDESYFRYGIQVNYFATLRDSKVYFSVMNFLSLGKHEGQYKPQIVVTPAFNYDFSRHWTIYAAIVNLEAGLNDPYCKFNLNTPRLGFLFNF